MARYSGQVSCCLVFSDTVEFGLEKTVVLGTLRAVCRHDCPEGRNKNVAMIHKSSAVTSEIGRQFFAGEVREGNIFPRTAFRNGR